MNNYAIRAFEVNALDYILKPPTVERVTKALSLLNDEFVEYKGGIGLQNIRNRLKLHFENEWSLSHDEKDGKVTVTLILPFL